jgi:hypothetical protein
VTGRSSYTLRILWRQRHAAQVSFARSSKKRSERELGHIRLAHNGIILLAINIAWQERGMTDTTHTINTATKRVARKSTGLLESAIVSLAGLAVTVLAITHHIPTALQLTVMQ